MTKTNKITGANAGGRSQAMRVRSSVVLVAAVLLSVVVGTPCFGKDDSTPVRGKGKGRVTIVYQDDAIQPENRDVIKKIRDSGTVMEPHLTDSCKKETAAARQKIRGGQ